MSPIPTNNADSSPAPETPATATPETAVAPRDPQQYAEWRTTGKVPAAAPKANKPKSEEPATSKDSSAPEKGEKGAPAPEAGNNSKQEQRPRDNAESRLRELLNDLKTAGFTPAELKTFRRESQAAAAAGDKDAKPPASSAAPQQQQQQLRPGEPKPPVKPDFEHWSGTWEEREAAKDKYSEELSDYKVAKALYDFQIQQAQAQQARELSGKIAEAQKRYGAEAGQTIVETAKALGFGSTNSEIPGTIRALVDQSPVIVDLLYVMGQKPEDFSELVSLAKTDPGKAIRKIVLLESLVVDELAKGAKPDQPVSDDTGEAQRDEQGRFLSPAKPKVSQAPPPAKEVSGRASAPPDPIEGAVKSGDFRAFREKQNARDLARHRG